MDHYISAVYWLGIGDDVKKWRKDGKMCIYEPLHGEYPTEETCKNGCEQCPFNVPDIPKPENDKDEFPY
jgi:hypothetical protein